MVPAISPSAIDRLTESTSIRCAQQIERQPIATPLSAQPILTSYVRQGHQDPPILLLHGFDSSVLEFRRLLPPLSEQFETWAVDLLGFGFTDRLPGLTFSPAEIKTHLYHFWKTMIARPVVLVGASMGGAAAIDFVLTYPEVVQQLVLIDSAGFAEGVATSRLLTPLAYVAAEFLRNPWVRDRVGKTAYHDPRLASLDAAQCAALHLQSPGWRRAIVAFTKSGGYNFLAGKVAEVQAPTLILWGRSDRILGIGDAAKFENVLVKPDVDGRSGSKLIWIEECGHVPHLEQPQITADWITQFIQTRDR